MTLAALAFMMGLMADAVLAFILKVVSKMTCYHARLISDTPVQVENLDRDSHAFHAFLKDTVMIRNKNERMKLVRKETTDAVYDVEDIMDTYLAKFEEANRMNCCGPEFLQILHTTGKKMEEISGRVAQLIKDTNTHTFDEHQNESPPETRRPRNDKNVVGFSDVIEGLIQRLSEESEKLDVISLIGMFGLGKTTLAWKIFNHPTITSKFHTRIWLSVSQRITEKDIFLRILENFTTPDECTRMKTPDELADMVADYLKKGSFLLVMDDVWSVDDWSKLRTALPLDEKASKVLITSRQEDVGIIASKPRPFVPLRAFEPEESWELFRLEALGRLECPAGLEVVGKKIAADCGGLPLAIVVIGGILYETSASDVDTRQKKWQKVSEHVTTYLKDDKKNRMKIFISLSCDNLPYHLRECFLYLGLFPEDHEISASKLIRMWIAEGFIQQKVAHITLEEVGQEYLKELINRNLVKDVKFRADGNVKTCQIHDTVLDFCRTEAQEEDFLQEIKFSQNGKCVPQISERCRRLSLHSDCKRYVSTKHYAPRARSFVCFSKDSLDLSAKESKRLIKAFKSLRVFDVQPFKFKEIDSDLYRLTHMRYIALSIMSSMLSPRFDKICKMQTLIINTTSPTLNVKANIWKMKHLRFFKTNASATLPKPKSTDCANELQTLSLISVESCKGLDKSAPNLKRLGIRGKLVMLFGEGGDFDSLRNMIHLSKLKLVNDDVAEEAEEPNCLPTGDRFPSGITSLTMCSTSLRWNQVSTLGTLEKLEVLKLKCRAFIGNFWNLEDEDLGFPSLKLLHIEGTDLATWNAKSRHFPRLRGLVLKDCDNLREIPIGLAEIQSFKMLELTTCPLAVDHARAIADKIKTSPEGFEFKLSIFPTPPPE